MCSATVGIRSRRRNHTIQVVEDECRRAAKLVRRRDDVPHGVVSHRTAVTESVDLSYLPIEVVELKPGRPAERILRRDEVACRIEDGKRLGDRERTRAIGIGRCDQYPTVECVIGIERRVPARIDRLDDVSGGVESALHDPACGIRNFDPPIERVVLVRSHAPKRIDSRQQIPDAVVAERRHGRGKRPASIRIRPSDLHEPAQRVVRGRCTTPEHIGGGDGIPDGVVLRRGRASERIHDARAPIEVVVGERGRLPQRVGDLHQIAVDVVLEGRDRGRTGAGGAVRIGTGGGDQPIQFVVGVGGDAAEGIGRSDDVADRVVRCARLPAEGVGDQDAAVQRVVGVGRRMAEGIRRLGHVVGGVVGERPHWRGERAARPVWIRRRCLHQPTETVVLAGRDPAQHIADGEQIPRRVVGHRARRATRIDHLDAAIEHVVAVLRDMAEWIGDAHEVVGGVVGEPRHDLVQRPFAIGVRCERGNPPVEIVVLEAAGLVEPIANAHQAARKVISRPGNFAKRIGHRDLAIHRVVGEGGHAAQRVLLRQHVADGVVRVRRGLSLTRLGQCRRRGEHETIERVVLIVCPPSERIAAGEDIADGVIGALSDAADGIDGLHNAIERVVGHHRRVAERIGHRD